MIQQIPADEVDLNGKALAVRYKQDGRRPELLRVSISAHWTDGDLLIIRSSEMRLIVGRVCMTRDALHARVVSEAEKLAIERVAWVEEG